MNYAEKFALLVIIFLVSYGLTGCLKRGLINAEMELNAIKAEAGQDVNAVKLAHTGAVEGQAGLTNTSEKTSAGRDIVNDSKLMSEVLNTYKSLTERYITLLRYIIYVLFTLLLKCYVIIFFVVKSMFKARDKDDAEENEMMKELVKGKKEDKKNG